MDWNDEAIGQLRSLWDEGHSTAEIGRRLGITKNAVVGKAHRLNLVARPSPIRRAATEDATRSSPPPRRISGPTLPSMAAPASAAAAQPAPARHPEPVPVPPALRAVPAVPRPVSRVPACCWPIGEPGTPSFRFCSDPAMGGKPYCAPHAAIAYVKVRDRRDDAA